MSSCHSARRPVSSPCSVVKAAKSDCFFLLSRLISYARSFSKLDMKLKLAHHVVADHHDDGEGVASHHGDHSSDISWGLLGEERLRADLKGYLSIRGYPCMMEDSQCSLCNIRCMRWRRQSSSWYSHLRQVSSGQPQQDGQTGIGIHGAHDDNVWTPKSLSVYVGWLCSINTPVHVAQIKVEQGHAVPRQLVQ